MIFTNQTLKEAVTQWMQNKEYAHQQWGTIENWDTSQVTDMCGLFMTDLDFVFHGGEPNNMVASCDLSRWNVSKVTNMRYMFAGAFSFTSDLSNWDTSQVTDMGYMFSCTTRFNSDLSRWDTRNVLDMSFMFRFSTSFSADLSKWDTSNVQDMRFMFFGATEFVSDLSKWNTKCTMENMFLYSRIQKDWNITSLAEVSDNHPYSKHARIYSFLHTNMPNNRIIQICIYL